MIPRPANPLPERPSFPRGHGIRKRPSLLKNAALGNVTMPDWKSMRSLRWLQGRSLSQLPRPQVSEGPTSVKVLDAYSCSSANRRAISGSIFPRDTSRQQTNAQPEPDYRAHADADERDRESPEQRRGG